MVNENPIVVVLRVVFGPLLKQASKLPPALAYGLATIIVISVVSLLGIILPPRVIYLIAVIALACLVAFVFLDWDTRRNHAVKTNIQDTNDDSKTPIPITSAKPSAPAVKATIKRSLQKHAVVDHERLIGVDELLHDIKERLIESEGSWIISLFGEGGVGKTALAYETVKRYISDQFTRFAWVSAKQRYFSMSSIDAENQDTELHWADLVKQIADQLAIELGYSRTSWLDEFRKGIKQLGTNESCLIVIDNLETVEDAEVVRFFEDPSKPEQRIVNPHKVLITTRKSILRYSPNIIEIPIMGLKPRSACNLIRFLGRGNPIIESVSNEAFAPILDVTEGNPFLIKLIVRRFLVSRKPLDLVLRELRALNSASIAAQVKDYLYVQSLEELERAVGENTTKQLMNAFCPRTAGELLSYEQLLNYSGIADIERFDEARRLACDLSLIRLSNSSLEGKYSIHSLLWEFTCKNA